MQSKKTHSPNNIQHGGSHYKGFAIQPTEYIIKNNIPFADGNVIKYVTRHLLKGGFVDIQKAFHYLQLVAYHVYGKTVQVKYH